MPLACILAMHLVQEIALVVVKVAVRVLAKESADNDSREDTNHHPYANTVM